MISFSSCRQEESAGEKQSYFSVPNYIKKEEGLLLKKRAGLFKNILFDKKSDSVYIDHPDWDKELELIGELDINKSAWKGSFDVDTLIRSGNTIVSYKPKRKEISVRLLQIFFNGSTPEKLHIIKLNQNFVYSSRMELWYYSQRGFLINGKQNVLNFLDKQYSIQANYN